LPQNNFFFELYDCYRGDSQGTALGRSATVEIGGRDQPAGLHLSLLSDLQGVVDLNSEVSDGALEFAMAEEELDGPEIPRPSVDQRRFGAA
jgi:hypothetical protein